MQAIRRLAIFNVSHEAGLFDLDRKQCIKFQPMPSTAKEKYIFIQSLSKARQIPPWELLKIPRVVEYQNFAFIDGYTTEEFHDPAF